MVSENNGAVATASAGDPTPADAVDPARILVLIPTLDEERHIEAVLRQLIEHDPVAARCRVVVADGGSTDRTREIVSGLAEAFPNLELVDNPKRLQSAALNLALGERFSQVEVLIRCDAHAVYPARFVSDLISALQTRDAASVVVPLDAVADGDCFQRGLAWIADTKLGAGGSPHRGGARSGYMDHGHHAAFRMSMFRALGGYDESFVANEDAEYDRRVAAAGGKIWLDAGIRKLYFPRRSPAALWRQYYRYGVGRARTCFKHGIRPAPRQMIPVVHVLLLAASLALAPFSWVGLAWPLAYGALIVGAGVATAVRRKSLCGLHATTALGAMHLAWGLGFLRQTAAELLGR